MKRKARYLMVFLLILLLAACNATAETPETPASQETSDEADAEQVAAIDYCDLPGGTRVTWFDLSTFIFIPQNSYQMGFDLPAGEFDFEPSHPVNLGAFWMHETEVTNRQYANCVATGPCIPPEKYPDLPYWFEAVEDLDDPVVGVTWEQADAYCEWIGARLPTEAEWELAARGVNSEPYPWGPDAPNCEQANFLGCQDPDDPQPGLAGLLPEGKSPFEILDMAGNVNEWVSDWYSEDYYKNSPATSPIGPDTGDLRVWRGGGYSSSVEGLYSYWRNALKPEQAQPDLGFRCAWSCGENVPPQLCQLPPVVEVKKPPLGKPEPSGPPKITGEGYCEWRGGTQNAGIVLSAPDGTDLGQYEFTSPNGDITCALAAGNLIVCHGAAVQPDSNVTLTVCPDCKPGYIFDHETGFCQRIVISQPGNMGELSPGPQGNIDPNEVVVEIVWEENNETCEPGYYYTSYCGCIPVDKLCEVHDTVEELEEEDSVEEEKVQDTVGEEGDSSGDSGGGSFPVDSFFNVFTELSPEPGQLGISPGFEAHPLFPKFPVPKGEDCEQGDLLRRCPPNTFPMTDVNGCRVCWPLRIMPDCPEGYFFDQEAECCIPEMPNPVCPWWTYFDSAANVCIPIVFESQSCFDVAVYVPACGPQQRPTPEAGCRNPSQYSTQQTCEAASCKWEYSVHPARGDCVMP